jgi:hypothetical protein
MQQFGTASVYGIDGTAAYDGGLAVAAFVSGYAGESQSKVDEFISGTGEFIGSRAYDKREYLDLTLTPRKTAALGSLNDALKALAYPPTPAKVVLTNLPDTDTAGGHAANEIGHNGDYMYYGGARRTMHQGQAALQVRVWRSLTSPLTTAQLLTLAT